MFTKKCCINSKNKQEVDFITTQMPTFDVFFVREMGSACVLALEENLVDHGRSSKKISAQKIPSFWRKQKNAFNSKSHRKPRNKRLIDKSI